MLNGLHLYSAFIDQMATKALCIFASHLPIHSLIHSYTDSSVSHARRHPEQARLGVLLMDTSTLGQVDTWSPSGL